VRAVHSGAVKIANFEVGGYVFAVESDPKLIIVRPVTAYPTPDYGEGD
jgi:hypothetical protein